MAIFSRRTLQRLIDENASFVEAKKLNRHVSRLNAGELGAEWEVVLLNIFNKLGIVEHEPDSGTKTADIYFKSMTKGSFVAEITTLSDKGFEKDNPIEYLRDRLWDFKLKNNLPGAFGIDVGGNSIRDIRAGRKPRVSLPPKRDFDKRIFNPDFRRFLDRLIANPDRSAEHRVIEMDTNLSIKYSPSGRTMSQNPSFTEFISITNNPVSNALVKKYDQLKRLNLECDMGIILCDGGCEQLAAATSSWYAKSSAEVIRNFLQKRPRITFVLVVNVESQTRISEVRHKFKMKLFEGPSLSQDTRELLTHLIKSLDSLSPKPYNDARNAAYLLKA